MRGRQSTTLSGPLLSLLKRRTVTLQAGASSSADTPYHLFDFIVYWLGEGPDGFFQLNQRSVVVVGGSSFELCHGHALEPSPGGTGPDSWPATGAWSGSWWLPPNLLFGQLLALIVVCIVAPSCWNQQELHIPRQWRAFVHRAVPFLFFFINLVRILWLEVLARTEPPLSRACCVGPVLYLPIAQSRVYGRI